MFSGFPLPHSMSEEIREHQHVGLLESLDAVVAFLGDDRAEVLGPVRQKRSK